MAHYQHLANLVILKPAIANIEKFKELLSFDKAEYNQEDNYLISFARMNPDEFGFEIEKLKELGVSDSKYVVSARYGGKLWDADWLICDGWFLWHFSENEKIAPKATKFQNLEASELLEKYGSPMEYLEYMNQ